MNYWLMKSEPDEFSIDDLMACPNQTEAWHGIRNYQARNFMRDMMQIGDQAFFYHSSCKVPGIVGIAEVVTRAYPDRSAFNPNSKYFDPKSDPAQPRWVSIDIRFVEKFNDIIPLSLIKSLPQLADMYLVSKGSRLSIQPVTAEQWHAVLMLTR
ncbi:Predicted RNA-binding protein, contains PUA-like domain [Shewanella morhuae]|uniref:EVE domain-containing protein n=1 Tax=Shewanella morhuae TaxID=365591 RepID=UPI000954F854|nr:EVE domain-containing protein [Shewanella morhuae]SIR06168.1 Predicted RNA-binding protein, contains PUA-like domain [Shewanella morhuae]